MKKYFAILLVLITGCKSQEKICSEFDTFFKKFASNSDFQKAHMDFPVMEYYSDEDLPLDIMQGQIAEEEYTFTDFTHDKELYDISIDKKPDTVYYVRTWRESHGAMTYKFARKNNCWTLVEFHDITD
jgi:hypothetical protein